jgi:imidazolonepropionase
MLKDFVIVNIGELVTFNTNQNRMLIYHDSEMIIREGRVAEIGKGLSTEGMDKLDAGGRLLTPGFIDSHTHPVFNATREMEYEMRIMGRSYMEIARAGGGILSSVQSLKAANRWELKEKVRRRLDNFFKFGTTAIEAKSGYGLSLETEIESLKILKELSGKHPIDVKSTFLGAHEYPEEYRENHKKYIEILVNEMIPMVASEGLADYCDVFCEEGVFSAEESRTILKAAKKHGLGIRLHADEFKPIGGVELACELGANSVDHLTAITNREIALLKESDVVPILLPATTFFLGSDKYAPGRTMWDNGLSVAVATDFNPGSSMTQSMPFVITLACLKLHLTPLEAIQAATINAAKSLNIESEVGSLEPGKKADFVIWKFNHYQGIPYFLCYPSIHQVWKNGEKVWESTN